MLQPDTTGYWTLTLPSRVDAEGEQDRDEVYMAEQRLGDLGGDSVEERILLNIRDQRKFFSSEHEGGKAHNRFAGMDAASVLDGLRRELGTEPFDIATLLPREGGKDDPDDGSTAATMAVTGQGKTAFHLATKQVTEAVRDRSAQLLTPTNTINSNSNSSNLNGNNITISSNNSSAVAAGGLPREVLLSVQSVHATTTEFLRHFWLAFLSGDEKRLKDINTMVASLKNSKTRIEAVAQAAEQQREVEEARRKQELRDKYRKTGVKPKKKDLDVGGGKLVVDEMLGPTVVAIDRALAKFQKALDEAERATSNAP